MIAMLIAVLMVAVGVGIDVGARLERRRQCASTRQWLSGAARLQHGIGLAFADIRAVYGDSHPRRT